MAAFLTASSQGFTNARQRRLAGLYRVFNAFQLVLLRFFFWALTNANREGRLALAANAPVRGIEERDIMRSHRSL